MKKLTSEKWKKFGTDGILFEELAKDLLELEYPGKTFYLTKHSHDGSKDGVCEIPLLEQTNIEIWLECKYHKDALAVREVAMTLVMAMLDNAHQIIFFSYSKVNRGFDKYIARYKSELKKEVTIYDDEALEDLIIKHWKEEKIRNYFLNVDIPIQQLTESNIIVSCDIKNCKKRKFYYLNEIIYIQIYLTNKNINKNYQVDICLDMDDTKYFRIVNRSFEKKGGCHHMYIRHNTSNCYEIPLQLIRYKKCIKIPTIIIKYDNKKEMLPRKYIQSRWIAETRLIGQVFYDTKSEALTLLQSHNALGAIHIYGGGGTGKSRLLQEIYTFSEYKVFVYDMEKQILPFKEFVQKLVSFMTGLPLFRNPITLVGDETFLNDDKRYATQILYKPAFDFINQKSELVSYFHMLFESQNFLIVIDNVQACDVETLDFLDKLVVSAETRKCFSFFLLSFNTDQLFPGGSAYELNEKLKVLAATNPKNYMSQGINGFDYKDACHFLNECLCWSDNEKIDLKETMDLFVHHCGTQPFLIQNVLLYMAQKGILKRTDTTAYYITDIPQFHEAIRTVPPNLNALLKKRESLLIEHLKKTNQMKDYERFIWLSSALQPFPHILSRALINNNSLLKELEELNFVQKDENNSVIFRHQLIGRYFQESYPIKDLPDELADETIHVIENRKVKNKFLFFYFQLCYFQGSLNKDTINDTIQEVAKYHRDNSFIELWMEAILDLLPEYLYTFDASSVAAALYHGCLFIAHRTGLKNGLRYYNKAATYILNNATYFIGNSEMACKLFNEYENSQLNTGIYMSVENFSGEIEGFLRKTEPDPQKLNHYLGEAKVQECIVLNALNQPSAALSAINEAFKIAESTNNFYLKMKALREQGYVYYYHEKANLYRRELAKSWQKCFEIFQKDYVPSLNHDEIDYQDQPTVAAYLVGLLGDLAAFNYPYADEKAKVIEEMLNKTNMPFYEIKLRLALSAYYFIKGLNQRQWGYYEIQNNLIHQAIDKCITYFSMRDYPVCFYLLGITQMYFAENALAYDNLEKAFLLAEQYSITQQIEKNWSYLFYDIAYYFCDGKRKLSQECLSGIKNKAIVNEVKKILLLSKTECAPEIRPVYTAITDENKRLNIPKV